MCLIYSTIEYINEKIFYFQDLIPTVRTNSVLPHIV